MNLYYTENKDKVTSVRISKKVLRLIKKNTKYKSIQSMLDEKILEILSNIEIKDLQDDKK